MNNIKRHAILLGLSGLLAVATVVQAGCSQDSGLDGKAGELIKPAKIVTVGESGSKARTYPGRVQAAQRVSLSFRVGGPVVELSVTKGQRVAAGELLARIDPRDYKVQVKNLEAQLAAVRAQQLQAGEEYQRVRGLFEHDNASKSDFDRARAALDVGQAQVEATEQALNAARLALADTELKAPYAGTVADRFVEAYQTVAAGQRIVLFQGAQGIEVLIDVPEREVAELTRKAPKGIFVGFEAVSGGEEVPARVKEFATETDPQTQTFQVTLELDGQPSADLLPGMTASVRWLTGNGEGSRESIVVPLGSVVTSDDGLTSVWRVDPESMEIERVPVTTGAMTKAGLEIVSGLKASDQILAAGVHFVTEGQKVRPLDSKD